MPDQIIVTKQLIEETFNGAAPTYNSIWFFKECGQRLIELLPINTGSNTLDIATGTGMVLLPAAKRVGPKGHVTGIDISTVMLLQAKQAVKMRGLKNIDLFKMDAEHLDFADNSFDAITCGFGIFFFPPTALREMHRACKPGGVIGVTVFEKTTPDPKLPIEIFRQQAKEYGLELKYSWPTSFTHGEIELLLANFGFTQNKTLRETKEKVYSTVEEYWEFILSSGHRMTIMSMDEATRDRFKDEYFNRLNAIKDSDGLRERRDVIYSIAQK